MYIVVCCSLVSQALLLLTYLTKDNTQIQVPTYVCIPMMSFIGDSPTFQPHHSSSFAENCCIWECFWVSDGHHWSGRIQWWGSVSVCLSVCMSVHLCVCFFIYTCPRLSVCFVTSLSVCLAIRLLVCLHYLSICMSFCPLPDCLLVCLPLFPPLFPGIIVKDCLIIMHTMLVGNNSNQALFREARSVHRYMCVLCVVYLPCVCIMYNECIFCALCVLCVLYVLYVLCVLYILCVLCVLCVLFVLYVRTVCSVCTIHIYFVYNECFCVLCACTKYTCSSSQSDTTSCTISWSWPDWWVRGWDLYILYSVYCAVHEICTYYTVYTVLYIRSVHVV